MATTVQHNPVLLQQQQQQGQAQKQQQNHPVEDEDVALANYISTSLRFDQVNSNNNSLPSSPSSFAQLSSLFFCLNNLPPPPFPNPYYHSIFFSRLRQKLVVQSLFLVIRLFINFMHFYILFCFNWLRSLSPS